MAFAKTTPAPDKITGKLAFDNNSDAFLMASTPPEGLSNFIIGGISISITCVHISLGIFI